MRYAGAHMSSSLRRLVTLVFTAASLGAPGFSASAWAQEQAPEAPHAIEELDLQELLALPIVSSSKVEQRAGQAPAVVTVVTDDDIKNRGYSSLAEILRVVPGFYDVYDQVTHNVGVRGINGGARASGNVLKVMIDGEPVDFRPTTGNFFGEELIPIEAIKRVEIIRGPASALYGANAFLGVVNIITRSGADGDGVRLIARGTLDGTNPGGGGGVLIGATADKLDLLFAATGLQRDRSGLTLPASSPALAATPGLSGTGPSQNDLSQASSLLLKQSLDGVAGGKLVFLASLQRLEAAGEFFDLAPLTHHTKVGWNDQKYRLSYQVAPTSKLSLSFSGAWQHDEPSASERLDLGRPGVVLLRRVGVDAFSLTGDGRYEVNDALALTGGADVISENHLLQRFDQLLTEDVRSAEGAVVRTQGTIIPGEGSGERRRFLNVGAFFQGVLNFSPAISLTAGGRLDVHSIYGAKPSARAALVYAPPDRPLSLKALYGSSFKAPSAAQLYSEPAAVLDVRGNPALQAQTAQTFELACLYGLPGGRGEVSLNLFLTSLAGRVEFVQRGLYLEAQNLLDEQVLGGEVESRFNLAEGLKARVSGGVARTVAQTAGPSLLGAPSVLNPLFPTLQVHLVLEYQLPVWGKPHLTAETSYVTSRPASQSNSLIHGSAYSLKPYVYTAAAITWAGPTVAGRRTGVALRVTNALDLPWAEPGFGGYDLPRSARAVMLTLNQNL